MFILRLLLVCLIFSQPACSQDSKKPVLLLNPTVYTGSEEVYENAALAFEDGKISLLADARLVRLDLSAYEVVEAYGLYVYPAALVEELPDNSLSAAFYTPLDDDTYLLLATDAATNPPVRLLEEGADATFVVTETAVGENEPQVRYLAIKGRLKRENNLSLQRITGDQ